MVSFLLIGALDGLVKEGDIPFTLYKSSNPNHQLVPEMGVALG